MDLGTTVEYAFCPPASGNHFNVAGQAPLPRNYYGPDVSLRPGNWVHNLEHGYVDLLYSCKTACPSQDVLNSMQQVMNLAPLPPDAASCGLANKVIVVRFDDMDTQFAALAWDRAMLMPTWDANAALTFAQQWQDGPQIPEPGTC